MLTQNHRGIRMEKNYSVPISSEGIRDSLRRNSGLAKTLAGVGVVGALASQAQGAEIYKTEPWTSWGQLYNFGSEDVESISNNGDFYVDGSLASNIKCGAGTLKDGNIIGHWDNLFQYNAGHAFGGSVNVDPSTNIPANNLNALVVGERNNGMWGTLDANGDDDWGYLDFWDNGMIDVHFDDYELILDQQGILVDGVRGDFSGLPRYLGSVDGMENNGKIGQVEFDSSYAIPEPTTAVLLAAGIGAAVLKKKVKGLAGKLFGKK